MRISATNFKRIYDPSIGEVQPWYINDHCLIQDNVGLWHLFGITHAEPASPLEEKHFAHATSKDLWANQWDKHSPVMHADENLGETHVWAPHIIKHDNQYWMFYCAGGEDHTRYCIHLATSPDLGQWKRHARNPLITDGFDARDPMVLRLGNEWIMYYTATRPATGGIHVVLASRSNDLIQWSQPVVVFESNKSGTFGGPTESPFVIKHNNRYYLGMCLGDPYACTAFYQSDDPLHWDIQNEVGRVPAHAAEVIALPDDKYAISHCGWGQGGVYLAELLID